MKRRFIFVLILLFVAAEIKASDEYSVEEIRANIARYNSMRIRGAALMGLGVSSLIVGVGCTAGTISILTKSRISDAEGNRAVAWALTGFLCLGVAFPLIIGGGVSHSVGSTKARAFQRLLEVSFAPGQIQLSVSIPEPRTQDMSSPAF
jgi:hypothetical protein